MVLRGLHLPGVYIAGGWCFYGKYGEVDERGLTPLDEKGIITSLGVLLGPAGELAVYICPGLFLVSCGCIALCTCSKKHGKNIEYTYDITA